MRAYPVLHPIWQKHFLKLLPLGGIIESELVAIPAMQNGWKKEYQQPDQRATVTEKDSHLPISGSIKHAAGFMKSWHTQKKLALEAGLLTLDDDYSKLLSPEFNSSLGQYSIAVGSTGNLGLSIGIMSAPRL